jgi:hypothetical protein
LKETHCLNLKRKKARRRASRGEQWLVPAAELPLGGDGSAAGQHGIAAG